jgi:hypothetical protein
MSNGASTRFWRNGGIKKLGSQDYTLRETSIRGSGSDDVVAPTASADSVQYRTYKRRWFGLVQLALMNIVVSWGVSTATFAFLLQPSIVGRSQFDKGQVSFLSFAQREKWRNDLKDVHLRG